MVDIRTELKINGTWVDITSDVYNRDPVHIVRGRQDEASSPAPTSCRLTINNRDGKYSRNPNSPYYGLIGRNTPIRVSVPTSTPHLLLPELSGGQASTPSATALQITGDLDVQIDLALDGVTETGYAEVVSRWTDSAAAWALLVTRASRVVLAWWDGTTAMVALSPLSIRGLLTGRRMTLRVTLDVDNGAGGHTVTFYTRESVDGPWTQVGDPVTATGTTSIDTGGGAPLEIGDTSLGYRPAVGRIYQVQVRNGIDGTVVANPDFTAQTPGATSFTDSAGRTWTVTAPAEITGRRIRFCGEVASWPQRWRPGGVDVWVPVEAAGIRRRLSQGQAPLQSALRRKIPSASSLVAYWPMEDEEGATVAASAVDSGRPMTVSGLQFGQATGLPGSAPLPTVGQDASMRGRVQAYTATSAWQVELVYRIDDMPTTQCSMVDVRATGTVVLHRVMVQTGNVQLIGYNAQGSQVYVISSTVPEFTGQWNRLQIVAQQSGGTVLMTLRWIVVGGLAYSLNPSYSGSIGVVTDVSSNFGSEFGTSLQGLAIGHVCVFNTANPETLSNADHGYKGESAAERIVRICEEENVPVVVTGGDSPAVLCGSTPIATLLDTLEDAAAVGGGMLLETRDTLALRYRNQFSMYNQPPALVLDYSAGEVAPPLEPTDDDQSTRNDVTVQRQGGSSARTVQDSGPLSVEAVGAYDESVTLNLANDSQCLPHATWRLSVGTVDEPRYPVVHVDLDRNPHLRDAVMDIDVLDRLQITNLPPWVAVDNVDLIVQGYEENLSLTRWTWQANCIPASPYTVGLWEDPVLGRADTGGSTLDTAVTASDTQLVVTTLEADRNRRPWVTSAGPDADTDQFPFDVRVGRAEVVTVSAVDSWARDAFDRTVTDSWGTADTGGAWQEVNGAASDRAVTGGAGRITLTSPSDLQRQQTILGNIADAEILVRIIIGQVSTGTAVLPAILFRYTSNSTFYRVRVHAETDSSLSLSVTRSTTQIGATVTGLGTYTAGSAIWLRARLVGHRLVARLWPTSDPEPPLWQIDRTITTDTINVGRVGLVLSCFAGNTNTNPFVSFDDFQVITPQRFTVTRAVNGVSRAWDAGTDVRLAYPMRIAL